MPVDLSIIIPTKNEEINIGRLIDSINNSGCEERVEIIVVDNPGTSDNTQKIAEEKGAKVLVKGPERSSQRNYGAKNAKGKYLYFVDADMEFKVGLLEEILESLKPKILVVVNEEIPGKGISTRARNIEKKVYAGNEKISAARIMSKISFDEVNGYNEEMISGEDWDLDIRLKKNGCSTIFLETKILHHEEGIGIKDTFKKKLYYSKNIKTTSLDHSTQINPFYRIGILFSNPNLIIRDPIAFLFLLMLKFVEFYSLIHVKLFKNA